MSDKKHEIEYGQDYKIGIQVTFNVMVSIALP